MESVCDERAEWVRHLVTLTREFHRLSRPSTRCELLPRLIAARLAGGLPIARELRALEQGLEALLDLDQEEDAQLAALVLELVREGTRPGAVARAVRSITRRTRRERPLIRVCLVLGAGRVEGAREVARAVRDLRLRRPRRAPGGVRAGPRPLRG